MNASPTPPSVSREIVVGDHALRALEFDRVLEVVAGYATSDPGADAVRARRPISDPASVAAQLDEVDEMVSWLLGDDGWSPPMPPDIRAPIQRLAVEGAVLSEAELTGVLLLLKAARTARRSFLPQASKFPRLGDLTGGLIKNEALEKRLSDALDEESQTLKDSASAELKRLRRAIRSSRTELVKHLEGVAAALPDRIAVPDASVTVRGGRYCIPIRREGRSEVGGIVHDESASRATLFVEPPSAIELMNQHRDFELSEAREVERMLRELTDGLRPHGDELAEALERLIHLDSLFARGRYALDRGCSRPALVERDKAGLRIVNGRHPLLLETQGPVVPFDLIMHPGEHTLLITGPNAGGKTVLLKAVGLISAMTQAGLLPPLGQGSELPAYSDIFADIGDEQSIDASLSTFTAHLRNLTELLEGADSAALCLIDEIGGATDPIEGTALARSVLIELANRGCMTLATSHLGGLKTLPGEHPAIVSAGLGFDLDRLEPLYKLTKGRPGRSYALAMAQRAGLPVHVIHDARSTLSQEEVDTERLLAELEAKEDELRNRLAEVARKEKKLTELEATLSRQAAELEERQHQLETEGRQQAREFLLEARKQVEEILSARRHEAERARSALEANLRSHTRALREASERRSAPIEGEEPRFEAGDHVWIDVLGRDGRVLERRGADVVVEVGGVKLQLAPTALQLKEAPEAPRDRTMAYSGPAADVRPEVHLRGLTSEEALLELIRALDAAVQAGLPQLRVVHGKGTGVLRAAVAEFVQHDRRVRAHRLGAPHEGGSGVTVLELE